MMEKQSKKKTLTRAEIERCDSFKQFRLNRGMSQDAWAKQIGISSSQVKKIESHKMKCSEKTMGKVRKFANGPLRSGAPFLQGLESLEENVICGVLLMHADSRIQEDVSEYASWGAKSFHGILQNARMFEESPEAQKAYFQFLGCLLAMLRAASGEAATSIQNKMEIQNEEKTQNGKNPEGKETPKNDVNLLDAEEILKTVFKAKFSKECQKSEGISFGKDGSISYQRSF